MLFHYAFMNFYFLSMSPQQNAEARWPSGRASGSILTQVAVLYP